MVLLPRAAQPDRAGWGVGTVWCDADRDRRLRWSISAACAVFSRLTGPIGWARHNTHCFFIPRRVMGLTFREFVALSGGHSLGQMHTDRSGYTGSWTDAPTVLSNK